MSNKYKKKEDALASPWENPNKASEALYHPSAKLAHVKVTPKTVNQKLYLEAMDNYDMVFGIGPAGSGKTLLAVAKAVQWLANNGNKLIITRPAVEAGEKLGFLPGDMNEKVDVYLRPIWDSLNELIGAPKVEFLIDEGFIEVAPLAFLRGRTFNDSFVILDEAQNATDKQMLLFLTRMGVNTKLVINGDPSQVDLLPHQKSGLIDAQEVLEGVEGIKFCSFDDSDIVRHPLVQAIVNAYSQRS